MVNATPISHVPFARYRPSAVSHTSPAGTLTTNRSRGYRGLMKLMRAATMIGIAKKVYDEARKPENQAKIKAAVERYRERKQTSRR